MGNGQVGAGPTNRKPFDLLAKGLSAGNWLPLTDEFRTFFSTFEALIPKPIEELFGLAS